MKVMFKLLNVSVISEIM